jgi:type IV secretion system protein VirD4
MVTPRRRCPTMGINSSSSKATIRTSPTPGRGETAFALVVLSCGAVWSLLYLGAAISSRLLGHAVPPRSLEAPFRALAVPFEPSTAWGVPMAPAGIYWSVTTVVLLVAATMVTLVWRGVAGRSSGGQVSGSASRAEVIASAGSKALLKRHRELRPGKESFTAADLGHRLGTSAGVACYSSVEDSVTVLGPPRSGKGLHLAIPMILDAPGAVLTTSTRPDNLTATMQGRAQLGPVAVFDPQGLAPGIRSATRWSPIRGCDDPHTAMVRAKALAGGTAAGTTDSSFWQSSAEQAIRCLLHAAALDGRTSADLYRWSLSALQAREAVLILATHDRAADSWHQALDGIISADARQRDSVWSRPHRDRWVRTH